MRTTFAALMIVSLVPAIASAAGLTCENVAFSNPGPSYEGCPDTYDTADGWVSNYNQSDGGTVCIGHDHNNSSNVNWSYALIGFYGDGDDCVYIGANSNAEYATATKRNYYTTWSRVWVYVATPSCNPLVDYQYWYFDACE